MTKDGLVTMIESLNGSGIVKAPLDGAKPIVLAPVKDMWSVLLGLDERNIYLQADNGLLQRIARQR